MYVYGGEEREEEGRKRETRERERESERAIALDSLPHLPSTPTPAFSQLSSPVIAKYR
jgi:hypothetical protein